MITERIALYIERGMVVSIVIVILFELPRIF